MLLCLFIVSFSAPGLMARPADYFLAGTYTNSGITIPYRLFVPQSYSSSVKYPIVLTLHGSGECGTDNVVQITNNRIAEIWAEDTNQARNPCFVFSPQVPDWDHRFPDVDMNQPNGYDFSTTPETSVEMNIMSCLDSLCRAYSIDTNRIYVTGLSMGGWGTWDLIIRFPNMFAAAIPMSGGGDPTEAARIAAVPVWDFHGGADPTVPVQNSQAMAAAFEALGIPVVRVTSNLDGSGGNISRAQLLSDIDSGAIHLYTEYNGAGHAIWPNAYDDPFVPPWLFAKSKAPVTGITVSTFTASPSTILNTSANTILFSATVSGTVTGVTIDLGSLGGANGVAMTAGTAGAYTYSFQAASGVVSGVKSVALHAANTIGTKDAFVSVTVNAPAQATTTIPIYTDAQIYPGFGPVGMSHSAPVEISTGASEGTKCYDYAFTLANWWDDFGFAVNNWSGVFDFSNGDTLEFDVKGPTIANGTVNFSFEEGSQLSTPNVITASAAWKTIKVPLAPLLIQGLDLSKISALYFGISGAQTGTGHVYVDNIRLIELLPSSVNHGLTATHRSIANASGCTIAIYSLKGQKIQTVMIPATPNSVSLADDKFFAANGIHLSKGAYIAKVMMPGISTELKIMR